MLSVLYTAEENAFREQVREMTVVAAGVLPLRELEDPLPRPTPRVPKVVWTSSHS